jgi:DNA topoisomerase VI subunit B
MSLVVRYSVDIFIEKEKNQKLTILKKVLGEEVYEKLIQLSNNHGKEIEETMIDLVELNCQSEQKEEKTIDDQWGSFSNS